MYSKIYIELKKKCFQPIVLFVLNCIMNKTNKNDILIHITITYLKFV